MERTSSSMTPAFPRLPLSVISDAIDAAVTKLANRAGISDEEARSTLARLNDTFDLFGSTVARTTRAQTVPKTASKPTSPPVAQAAQEPAQAPSTPAAAPELPDSGKAPRGALTAAILNSLPARAPDIAIAIGKPVTSINSTLSRLVEKGTVVRTGSRGDYVYRAASPVESSSTSSEPSQPADDVESTLATSAPEPPVVEPEPEPAPPATPSEPAEAPQEAPAPSTGVLGRATPAVPQEPSQAPQEATVDDLFTDPSDTPSPAPAERPAQEDEEPIEASLDDLTVPDLLEIDGE